jgi:hypothetical protein
MVEEMVSERQERGERALSTVERQQTMRAAQSPGEVDRGEPGKIPVDDLDAGIGERLAD